MNLALCYVLARVLRPFVASAMLVTGVYAVMLVVLGQSLLQHRGERSLLLIAALAGAVLATWWWRRRRTRAAQAFTARCS